MYFFCSYGGTNHKKKKEWRKQGEYSETITENYFMLVTERKTPVQRIMNSLKYTELLRLYSDFDLFLLNSEKCQQLYKKLIKWRKIKIN